MGMKVVHVVPSEFLATDLYDYLVKLYPGKYSLVLDEGDEMPGSGIVLTTYAWVTGKMLSNRGGGVPLGDCVLYADEVHESDCYVEFVRRLAGKIPGVKCFVEASATHSPDRMPKREQKGEAETQMFVKESPDTWQPADISKPWSAIASGGNVLVYMDDKMTAETLVARYGACGVQAYRLHSKMDREEFRRAMRAMRDTSGGIVALVAEYTFRNGFTFDVSRIIDSGLVKYYVYDDGTIRTRYRVMYELEKYQTMARGARTVGSSCVYYMPKDLNCDYKLCSLEGVECEGAALLFRLYGYAPPVAVQEVAVMRQGPIPKNLYGALNGALPLTGLPADAVQPMVVPESTDADFVADVVDTYGFPTSPVLEVSDLFADISMGSKANYVVGGDDEFLNQLQEMSSAARSLMYGYYYACTEAVDTGALGRTNWQQLLESLHNSPLLITGYSHEMRTTAVAMLLREYNKCMVFGAAVSRIGAHKERLHELSLRNPSQVQTWSAWMAEKANWHKMMANSMLIALDKLRTPTMNFISVESDGKVEEAKARDLMKPLLGAVSAASAVVDTGMFFEDLQNSLSLEPGPEFPESREPEGHMRKFLVFSRTTSVLGFVKHNLEIYPKLVGLSEQDYVDAITTLLHEKGIVATAVHNLKIDAPNINPKSVMQKVRDGTAKGPKRVVYNIRRVITDGD